MAFGLQVSQLKETPLGDSNPVHRITVQSMGCSVGASVGASMLDALLDGGVDYPHGCTTGLCSLCKSRLITGAVTQVDAYASALSDEDRAAGLFLPCCATPQTDCLITPVQQDALLPPVQRLTGTVTHASLLTHDIVRVVVTPEDGGRLDFLPGQYVELALGDLPSRDFSVACVPGDSGIEVMIRRLPDGQVTSALDPLKIVGWPARVRGPFGAAYLKEAHTGPMIGIAGGSGLAPIRSIVRAALDRGMRQHIHVIFGARTERDVYLEDEFRALCDIHPGLTFEVVLSGEAGASRTTGSHSTGSHPSGRRYGMVHEALRDALAGQDLSRYLAYIAGPPVMVEAVSNVLGTLGLPKGHRRVDPFLTRADVAKSRNAA